MIYIRIMLEICSNHHEKMSLRRFRSWVRHDFTIREGKTDIVFSGLGWVTVPEAGAKVAAYVPKGVSVLLRKSLI